MKPLILLASLILTGCASNARYVRAHPGCLMVQELPASAYVERGKEYKSLGVRMYNCPGVSNWVQVETKKQAIPH